MRKIVIICARHKVPLTLFGSVQNLYNLANRTSEAVLGLGYCTSENIGFIPWFALDTGNLAKPTSPLTHVAEKLGEQPAQVALARLLKKSPAMLPIPATSKVDHLETNTAAAPIELDASTMQELEQSASNTGGASWLSPERRNEFFKEFNHATSI